MNYGNQPTSGMAHLFNYSRAPWLTQKWVREVHELAFSGTTPYSGYAGGDEDQGQQAGLSALMAIGLFDVQGGAGRRPTYQLTTPIFERITIHLDDTYYEGDKFIIDVRGSVPEDRYIQSAALDGDPLNKPWIYHDEVVSGGRLLLEVGPDPNKTWGSAVEARPPSMTE